MKIQRLICTTCEAVFAVSVDISASDEWYKNVEKHLTNGTAKVETIEHPNGSPFGDKKISNCCGGLNKHGGKRSGSGRPKSEPTATLSYRVKEINKDKIDKLCREIIAAHNL